MRLSRKRTERIAPVCAAFFILLAIIAVTLGGIFGAGNARANGAGQGMGMQPCVLAFGSVGEALNGAAPTRAASDAGFAALPAAGTLLVCACSCCIYQGKFSIKSNFTPVSLRVRMDE